MSRIRFLINIKWQPLESAHVDQNCVGVDRLSNFIIAVHFIDKIILPLFFREIEGSMSETELLPQRSKTKPLAILLRHPSSESESGCESGFHSDLSDELISSQPSTADSLDEASIACHE